jgi:hypothetical protein
MEDTEQVVKAIEPVMDKHGRHQAMLEKHKLEKIERREDHIHPNRKKKIPANSLI